MGFLRGLKINMRKAHPRGKMLISKVALAGTLGLACILLIANFGWNPGVDPKDCEYWFISMYLGERSCMRTILRPLFRKYYRPKLVYLR